MAKSIIKTIKKIALLDKRELRLTEIDGVIKLDVRAWKDDEHYDDGVRFTDEEFIELASRNNKVGNKNVVLENGVYTLQIINNGRLYKREFATETDFEKLCTLYEVATEEHSDLPLIDALIECGNKLTDIKKVEIKETKVEYTNGYDKFKEQFEKFRESLPENQRKGYEKAHNILLEHIKEICDSSKEYNANCLQEWKTSHNLMTYTRDRAYENPELLMVDFDKQTIQMFQWVDEYIGLDDKPKPVEKKPTTKKASKKPKKKAS